jgi:cob(I)alamin adenosyltransferase
LKKVVRNVIAVATPNVNMPIYTRSGDSGTTSLYGGKRVLKSEELVNAYGSIDELNSWIGLIVSEITIDHLKKLFLEIQSDLLTIGSNLAGGNADLSVLETRVPQMEVEIDVMDKELPKLTNFILPGGSTHAAYVHITRNVCRRVERRVVALTKRRKIDGSIIKYLNRLSDLLFVVARYINRKSGIEEVVWSIGE